jgi:hypothetical protein
MTTPAPHATVVLVKASDLPDLAPCCAHAHEMGYRHGYKDGYTYAFCDAGKRLTQAMWGHFWDFRQRVLLPWMERSYAAPTEKEAGPRFSVPWKRAKQGVDHDGA